LHLHSIRLTQFRNYEAESIVFHPGFNVLTGANGMGKTNILDAVYYLCLGKSYFSAGDKFVVRHGSEFFRLEGTFRESGNPEKVVIKSLPGNRKEIEVNGKKLERIGDLVGRYGCVIISPDDIHLMLEGSEERRNFINNTIVQTDTLYLDNLLLYTQLLKRRNSLLKTFADGHTFDPLLLDTVSESMAAPSFLIHNKRQELVRMLSPVFNQCYGAISGSAEQVGITYQSQLESRDLITLFADTLAKDRLLARTTAGIHRDDLVFTMDGEPLKAFASQGQLKSFVLSLKLAQYSIMQSVSGRDPILLLDDIFDKLDHSRVQHLLALLHGGGYGQVFITDTEASRMKTIMDQVVGDYHMFEVSKGNVSEKSSDPQPE
jgi:DNA replication and repair protein RecF